jgi:cullin 1
MVLGKHFWPLSAPHSNFVIPADIQLTHDRFQGGGHYQVKHSGRKLTCLWNYSTNELQIYYLIHRYILMTR